MNLGHFFSPFLLLFYLLRSFLPNIVFVFSVFEPALQFKLLVDSVFVLFFGPPLCPLSAWLRVRKSALACYLVYSLTHCCHAFSPFSPFELILFDYFCFFSSYAFSPTIHTVATRTMYVMDLRIWHTYADFTFICGVRCTRCSTHFRPFLMQDF